MCNIVWISRNERERETQRTTEKKRIIATLSSSIASFSSHMTTMQVATHSAKCQNKQQVLIVCFVPRKVVAFSFLSLSFALYSCALLSYSSVQIERSGSKFSRRKKRSRKRKLNFINSMVSVEFLILIVTLIELGPKKRDFLCFNHTLRCDWWFTSYEWNANNSVRAHSQIPHTGKRIDRLLFQFSCCCCRCRFHVLLTQIKKRTANTMIYVSEQKRTKASVRVRKDLLSYVAL